MFTTRAGLAPRPVARSVDELIAGASLREPFAGDGKSGAVLERVVIDDESFVLKHVDLEDDWIMRQTGDLRGYAVTVWASGIFDLLPPCIDHAYAGAAHDGRRGALLLRDVSEWLVPDSPDPIALDQHLRFLDHLAQVHAACWGFTDTVGLVPLGNRYCWFSGVALDLERARGFPSVVPRIASDGWAKLPDVAPELARVLIPLRDAPWPLVEALSAEPTTLVQGDWKLANLGTRPDGRTVLLDWALPGAGPPLLELAHYVALNAARLPVGHSKEDVIAAYRAALERHGIETSPWFDRQLELAFVGMLVLIGWEKALSGGDELAWWSDRVLSWADRR